MSDQPGLRLVAISAAGPGRVRLDGAARPTITAALADAAPGSIVDVGRGRYGDDTETFPLRVPGGVTLRGPEPPAVPSEARKHLPTPQPAELVATGPVVEVVGSGAHLEHLTIRSVRPGDAPALRIGAHDGVGVDTCVISGSVDLSETTNATIRWTTIEHGQLAASDVDGLVITGGSITGTHGTAPLVGVDGGRGVRVEAMAITGGRVGVALMRCDDVLVGGCAILADDAAIRAEESQHLTLNGNRLRGHRAVQLTECIDGEIAANGVEQADIAFALAGCTSVEIGANHLAEVRVDLDETPA